MRIAIAYLGCGWFDPITFRLDAIATRVASDSIVIRGDHTNDEGARLVTDQFLAGSSGHI